VSIMLTPDQQRAYYAFDQFLCDPNQTVLRISGYAGTGKSTLIATISANLASMLSANQMVSQQERDWTPVFTATTNKACEAFAKATGEEVQTIHSFLGLIIKTNYREKTTSLEPTRRTQIHKDKIIFIDEASYVDHVLLDYIFEYLRDCKIVFIGDPAQLAPVKTKGTPVYECQFPEVALTEVVRQAEGNPIIDLATAFRNTVNGEGWLEQFIPDGHHVQYHNRDDFEALILKEFDRPDWHFDQSKVLAYTNKTVQRYNQAIRAQVQGEPQLQTGDYAVVNSAMTSKTCKLRTDQLVCITDMKPAKSLGVSGWEVTLDGIHFAFLPESFNARKERLKKAYADENMAHVATIDQTWIDLRAAYACTINKSQGSTFDRVFIDLDDVRTCRNPNTLARLLYVAVSRAREQVILTGDLVAKDESHASTASAA